jgi:hypothetical protein
LRRPFIRLSARRESNLWKIYATNKEIFTTKTTGKENEKRETTNAKGAIHRSAFRIRHFFFVSSGFSLILYIYYVKRGKLSNSEKNLAFIGRLHL